MTLSQFLSILKARWLSAVLVLVLTLSAAIGVSLLLPKRYTAAASVVLDFKPDPVSAVVYGGAISPAVMATQVDILKSDRVALRVVRNLRLAEDPSVRAQWLEATDGSGTIEQWLVDLFQRQMDVLPTRESNVLTIIYKAPDPRFASALANAFVDAYLQTSVELRVNPAREFAGFFDQRAKEARDALEKAQARLSEFQARNGIIATDERLDIENARLSELSSQLVALQAISAESQSRQQQADSARGDRLQEVLVNPVITTLKADLNRAEARLQEIQTRFGDAHPSVLETRANITELRARIDAETRRITSGVGVTNSINRGRESQVRSELDAQRAKVLRMKQVRDEAAVIVRDVENAQRAYDAILNRQNLSNIESQTNQSNVNLLSRAVPPVEPSSPRLLLNALLGVFVGALLAVAVAIVRELLDRRVRAIDDIGAALHLPVLGVLPKPNAKRRKTALALNRTAPPAVTHTQGI